MSERDWREDIRSALRDFEVVSDLAGIKIVVGDQWDIEWLCAPHRRPKLPQGKQAVYGFYYHEGWLKIGRAGPNSQARYTSQHYIGGAGSTLFKSLRGDDDFRSIVDIGLEKEAKQDWAAWIERNTHRVNILLPARCDPRLVSLLEAFLHVRLWPRYEG